jgi:hypothetical protein
VTGPAGRPGGRGIWFTRRALLLHLTLVIVVPTFLGLFWWQVQRVRQGNTLSWAYVFEWPFFTGYAVYLWWRLVHEPPDAAPVTRSAGRRSARDEEEDREMEEYNRYLAELDAHDRQKKW